MDLSVLRTFLAAYRAGSLTGAAERLGLSQPTVTAQIRGLETQLGQQLFERLPRGVAPTSVAEELAGQIATHIDALSAITERGLSERDPLAKPVHLAGPAELTSTLVLPSLADLVERGLKLRITLGLAPDLLAGLAAGRYEIVISTIRPRGKAITAVPLTDEEFVLVAAPVWADRMSGSQDPRRFPLIAYAEDLPLIRRYWRMVFGSRPNGNAAVVIPDLRGVLAATVAGAGITVLPRYLCGRELAAGDLVPLLRPQIPPINTLFLATRTGTADLPHIAAVHRRLLMQARLW